MQISIDVQLALNCVLVHDGRFDRVDCRVKHWVWFAINAVKIQALRIAAPIASFDTIWVQQRHKLEHEAREEQTSLGPVGTKEVKHALMEK